MHPRSTLTAIAFAALPLVAGLVLAFVVSQVFACDTLELIGAATSVNIADLAR